MPCAYVYVIQPGAVATELQQQLMDMSMENTGGLDASRSALDRMRTEVEDITDHIEGVSVCLCVRVCS